MPFICLLADSCLPRICKTEQCDFGLSYTKSSFHWSILKDLTDLLSSVHSRASARFTPKLHFQPVCLGLTAESREQERRDYFAVLIYLSIVLVFVEEAENEEGQAHH